MAKSLKDEILDDLIQDIQDVASVEIDDTFKEQLVFTSKDKWYNTFPLFYGYDYPEIYERRYNNKGLLDETKMITEVNKTSGKTVEVKFYSAVKGKKSSDAVLVSYDGENVVLDDGKETFSVSLKNIVRMNEFIDFN